MNKADVLKRTGDWKHELPDEWNSDTPQVNVNYNIYLYGEKSNLQGLRDLAQVISVGRTEPESNIKIYYHE